MGDAMSAVDGLLWGMGIAMAVASAGLYWFAYQRIQQDARFVNAATEPLHQVTGDAYVKGTMHASEKQGHFILRADGEELLVEAHRCTYHDKIGSGQHGIQKIDELTRGNQHVTIHGNVQGTGEQRVMRAKEITADEGYRDSRLKGIDKFNLLIIPSFLLLLVLLLIREFL